MSSKKARRKARQERQEAESRRAGRFSPATLFMLGIGLAVVVIFVGALLLGDRSGRGEPPYPGAVWNEPHGHWH